MPLPPRVVIVGRKNAGKSTLFNRLIEERKSITSSSPGTTRDSNEAVCNWRGRQFNLIDTGGLDIIKEDTTEQKVLAKTLDALSQAQIILYLVDGRLDPSQEDRQAINRIKKKHTGQIFLVVNKLDSKKLIDKNSADFFKLGVEDTLAVSATLGIGTGDLLDEIASRLPVQENKRENEPDVKIVVLGKPNVGKSSLINAILSRDRLIISKAAGTTRDAQEILFKHQNQNFLLIDTAGLRRKSKVGRGSLPTPQAIEIKSVQKSLKALGAADVALLVLDVTQQITSQDKRIAKTITNERKGLVIVANKWDLVQHKDEKTMNSYRQYISACLPFLNWAPLVFVSAKTGLRVRKPLDMACKIKKDQDRVFTQEVLATFIKTATRERPPTKGKGTKRPRLVSFVQDQRKKLRFILTIGQGEYLSSAYKSFLANALRDFFDLAGSPIEIIIKKPKKN